MFSACPRLLTHTLRMAGTTCHHGAQNHVFQGPQPIAIQGTPLLPPALASAGGDAAELLRLGFMKPGWVGSVCGCQGHQTEPGCLNIPFIYWGFIVWRAFFFWHLWWFGQRKTIDNMVQLNILPFFHLSHPCQIGKVQKSQIKNCAMSYKILRFIRWQSCTLIVEIKSIHIQKKANPQHVGLHSPRKRPNLDLSIDLAGSGMITDDQCFLLITPFHIPKKRQQLVFLNENDVYIPLSSQ